MLDIEVDDSDGYPDLNVFDKEIISICCYDNFKEKYHVFYVEPNLEVKDGTVITKKLKEINYYSCGNEKALLEKFVSFVKYMDFDLIFAWNGDGFDYPYIWGRMKINGIEPEKLSPVKRCEYRDGKPVGRYWIDLMAAFRKVATNEFESYSLDYIGKSFIGRGKVEHTGKVGDLWRSDIATFLRYNINDVQLMVDIEKKRGIIRYFDTIRRLTFCSFYDVFFNSRVLDCYFLKRAQELGIILPNKPQPDGEYDPIQGARVIAPISGLHRFVAVGDVRSLYPTAFLTANMSPETIDAHGRIVVGDTRFSDTKRGFIPIIIQELWDLRQSWKSNMKQYPKGSAEYEQWDNLQTVCKFLLNSIYGVMLMPAFRLFDKRIGAAITYFGRETNLWMDARIREQGYEILAGDTDSIIFHVGKDDPTEAKNAIEYVNDTLNHFCESKFGSSEYNKMYIEFDKMYSSILFTKNESGEAVKKRYAGLIYVSDGKVLDEPILDVKGFDSKRSDSPQFIRDLQKEVFVMILTGKEKNEVKARIKEVRNNITNGTYTPEMVAIPKGMSKQINEYDKSMPIHITGAKYFNEYCGGNIKREKVKYLYVSRVPARFPKTHVVSFIDKAPDGFIWDMDKMAVKLVDEKFKNILYSMGWSDQTTLACFC
jgi:DNA polymerase I